MTRCILVGSATSAMTEVRIGINLRSYPELVLVPGYPVYCAPRLPFIRFFYDGLYWVYQGDQAPAGRERDHGKGEERGPERNR